ncbi:vacuolar sorting protein 9 domain-containing protein [Tieghemostelium lacteum]|uniref:Vacuolar sorting protein 9 domain-containing protein n=1 Tax=Tieghemostelium lacteum TaxID=361077 RepID=A0A152A4B1_TIELA|nr:vacuolar sorting protein 9 domain-containing protein [Tieghemostelium lacteum]|eukprot:KYR01080.1 vacuolar sorting protein 9 domain-containing protein [Tieghemostelium lacteum]
MEEQTTLKELNNNNSNTSTTTSINNNNINNNNNTIVNNNLETDNNIPAKTNNSSTFKSSLSSFLSSYTPTTKVDSNLVSHFKSSISLLATPITSIAYPIGSGISTLTSNIPLISYISSSIPFPISYSKTSSPPISTTIVTNPVPLQANVNTSTASKPIPINNSNNNSNQMVTSKSPTTSNMNNTFSSFSQKTNQSILNNQNNTSNTLGTEEQYDEILQRLEQSEFSSLLVTIHSFIDNINQDQLQSPVSDISASVKSFIQSTLPMVLHACASVPFKSKTSKSPCIPSLIGKSTLELETITYEFMEQYITSRLYRRIFSSQDGIQKDTALCEHISQFQFITPSHLDINDSMISDQFLEQIQEELLRMTAYKSPRDKLICIKKSFETLFRLLSKSNTPIGADLLLPIIIYCLIKSNLPFLYSNLQYISLFRNPNFIEAETNYYLVTLITATSFIQDMTMDSLTNVNPNSETIEKGSVRDVEKQKESINKSPKESIPIVTTTTTSIVVSNENNSSSTSTSSSPPPSNTNIVHQHEEKQTISNNSNSQNKTSKKISTSTLSHPNLPTITEPQDQLIEAKKQMWKYYHSSPEDLSIKDVKKLILDFNQLVDFWYEHNNQNSTTPSNNITKK